ncbi:MAG: IclR family transcriptional regulator [Desulfotomaculaceae bacterium]|nr:IclR family transcriptional regulator [Desulfotomaculaceae bacterium]
MIKESSSYNAPLVYKIFSILDEVAKNPSLLGISDLSRILNISKSTVYGITKALIEIGILRQKPETKKFRLGPSLIHLGNQALGGVDLRTVAKPLMEEITRQFGETIFLGIFDKQGITIIDKCNSPMELKISSPVGTRIPLLAGATGKVFLAGLEETVVNKLLKEKTLPKFTENSITDPVKYHKEIQNVRRMGYATDFEEYIRGVNAICTPIPNSWGWPATALWMVGFSQSLTKEKISMATTALIQAAIEISETLGN